LADAVDHRQAHTQCDTPAPLPVRPTFSDEKETRMVRRTLAAMATTAVLLAALAGQALAHPPATHLHCLNTPNGGVHSIARGVTFMAPHDIAFHNFHGLVHVDVFNAGHPLSITPVFGEDPSC
jgi:hypothetical protein